MPTVRDILGRKGRDVVSAPAAGSVLDAARLMNQRGIGGVVVMEGGTMVGIFTERDLMRRVVAEQRNPAQTTLRDVMTSPVVQCAPGMTLDECRALMTERRVRHLPVVDEGTLSGIVTTGDLLAYQIQEQQDTIQHLNAYVSDQR